MSARFRWPGAALLLVAFLNAASAESLARPCATSLPVLGVNRAALCWISNESQLAETLQSFDRHGVKAVRFMLVPPFDRCLRIVERLHAQGIGSFLTVPLTQQSFYGPSARRRPASPPTFPAVSRLSQIELDRFADIWSRIAAHIESRRLPVMAIQIGTEFNSAHFNGDLPIWRGRGEILDGKSLRNAPFWPAYERGMRKLVSAARMVRRSQQAQQHLSTIPIVLGAFARPSPRWLRLSGNMLVDPAAALLHLQSLGIDELVDAYSVHIYPPVEALRPARHRSAIAAKFEDVWTPLLAAGSPLKRWWITEWGFRLPAAAKRPGWSGEDQRGRLFEAYLLELGRAKWRRHMAGSFIFDWDQHERYRISGSPAAQHLATSLFRDRELELSPGVALRGDTHTCNRADTKNGDGDLVGDPAAVIP